MNFKPIAFVIFACSLCFYFAHAGRQKSSGGGGSGGSGGGRSASSESSQTGCPDVAVEKMVAQDIMSIKWLACYHTRCFSPKDSDCCYLKFLQHRNFECELSMQVEQAKLDKKKYELDKTTDITGDVKLKQKTDGAMDVTMDSQREQFPHRVRLVSNHSETKCYSFYSCDEEKSIKCGFLVCRNCARVPRAKMSEHLTALADLLNMDSKKDFHKTSWNVC